MKTVRIGNDITIRWTLVFADSGDTLAGKDLKLYLKHPLITKREVTDYIVEDNAVTWVFRGAEQKKTGVYSLELVCNDGADGMWTIDACDAVELVPCTCKTGCPGGDVELFGKVDTLNGNVIVTAVDKELDSESENPIANMAVAKEIEALKENAGSSAFVVETTGNQILNLNNNSTSATILNAIGGDFNAIAQAIRDGRQIQFKNTTTGGIINADLTGYSESVSTSTESISLNIDGDDKHSYKREITKTNGVLKCNVVNRNISNGVRIGSNAYIGGNVNISDNISIGSDTHLSDNVRIGSNIYIQNIHLATGLRKNIPTIYVNSAGYSHYDGVNGIIIGSEDCDTGLSIFAYDSCAIPDVAYGTECVRINYRNIDCRIGTESLYLNGVKLGTGSSSGTPPNISTKVYIVGTYETELGLKCHLDYNNNNEIGMEIGTKGSFLGGYSDNSLLLYAYGSGPIDVPSSLIGTPCIRLGFQNIDLLIGSKEMYLNGNLVGGGGTGSGSDGVIIGFESNVGYEKSGFVFSAYTMGSGAKSSIGTNAIICSGARIGTDSIFGGNGLGDTHVDYGIRIFSLSTCILIEDRKGHSVYLA